MFIFLLYILVHTIIDLDLYSSQRLLGTTISHARGKAPLGRRQTLLILN